MTTTDDDEAPLVPRGHGAGDVLEAWNWRVLDQGPGLLLVECDLPEHLKNPQGQLFGGFTPTYVDFISIHTVHTLDAEPGSGSEPGRGTAMPGDGDDSRAWMVTINMRCDYFEPILGPTFTVHGELINQRGLTSLVGTKFYQGEVMAAHAITTLRMVPGVRV
jgi:acyl-coenzyme A thioesterase PaaI-like protein